MSGHSGAVHTKRANSRGGWSATALCPCKLYSTLSHDRVRLFQGGLWPMTRNRPKRKSRPTGRGWILSPISTRCDAVELREVSSLISEYSIRFHDYTRQFHCRELIAVVIIVITGQTESSDFIFLCVRAHVVLEWYSVYATSFSALVLS